MCDQKLTWNIAITNQDPTKTQQEYDITQSEAKQNLSKTQPEPSQNLTGTQQEPNLNSTRTQLEHNWNTTGIQPEPNQKQTRTNLEHNRNPAWTLSEPQRNKNLNKQKGIPRKILQKHNHEANSCVKLRSSLSDCVRGHFKFWTNKL